MASYKRKNKDYSWFFGEDVADRTCVAKIFVKKLKVREENRRGNKLIRKGKPD